MSTTHTGHITYSTYFKNVVEIVGVELWFGH
jgi:hypothetical protein